MWEVPKLWTFKDTQECVNAFFYLDTTREEFYRILLNPLNQKKFVRVNDTLTRELLEFNWNEATKRRRTPKIFVPHLAASKQAEKYRWKTNDEVRERDTKKPLTEIGILNQEQKRFSDAVLAYSKKSTNRILALGYISEAKKPRIYVRYSTLTEHPKSAESIIQDIRKTLWLPVLTIESISE